MNTELDKVDARQGDRRKMSMVVLFWSVPGAFVLLGVLYAAWASWG